MATAIETAELEAWRAICAFLVAVGALTQDDVDDYDIGVEAAKHPDRPGLALIEQMQTWAALRASAAVARAVRGPAS